MFTAVLFIIACAIFWKWQRRNVKSTEPPVYPGAWPVIGHLPLIFSNTKDLWDQLQEICQNTYDMGGVLTGIFGPRTVYGVTDPEDCVTVANTCFEKDRIYNFGKSWIGDGLITSKYLLWKNHRKLLNPAFSQTVLDTFIGVFNSQSRKLVKDLEKEVGKGFFDHRSYMRLNALETICLTALGVDFTDSNLNRSYIESVDMFMTTAMQWVARPWLHYRRFFAWSSIKKEQDACVKIMHNMSNTVLQKRQADINGNKVTQRSIIPGVKFKPFIDILLELSAEEKVFTDKQIREHVDTMLVAGHDTTANVLMFTMILLGSYPDVQEKVFSEIQDVLGGDRDVEKTDFSKLVYLEAVLKESMRTYTIAPIVGRRLDRDVKLKNCTLSAGRTCVLFLFGVHRHPMWGPEAHEFKPERWLDPGKLPENPNAFAAFGLGKRHCIGRTYSLMSLKTNMVHLVRSYRIKADHTKLRIGLEVLLKPIAGYCINLEKRST